MFLAIIIAGMFDEFICVSLPLFAGHIFGPVGDNDYPFKMNYPTRYQKQRQ